MRALIRRSQRFAVAAIVVGMLAPAVAADEVVSDENGNIVKIIHSDGSETRMTYDEQGRLIVVERADGNRFCTTYENGIEETSPC